MGSDAARFSRLRGGVSNSDPLEIAGRFAKALNKCLPSDSPVRMVSNCAGFVRPEDERLMRRNLICRLYPKKMMEGNSASP